MMRRFHFFRERVVSVATKVSHALVQVGSLSDVYRAIRRCEGPDCVDTRSLRDISPPEAPGEWPNPFLSLKATSGLRDSS